MANTIQISADTTGFISGIKKAEDAMKGFGQTVQNATKQTGFGSIASSISNTFKSIKSTAAEIATPLAEGDLAGTVTALGAALVAIPAGAVVAATGLALVTVAAVGMNDAMTKAKGMNIMAEQAGMTATQFSTLTKVFSKIGIEAEQLPGVMSKMAASLGEIDNPSSKAAEALGKMGITLAMLDGKSQYEQFKLITAGINGMTSASAKMQAARAIFGKTGAMLLPAMRPEAIAKAETKVSPMAQIAEESGGAFLAFQGAMKGLKVDIGGFFAGMASNVIPALQSVVEALGKVFYEINVALASAGKTMGEGIAFWITAAKQGFAGIGSALLSIVGAVVLFLMNSINSALVMLFEGFDALKSKLGLGKSMTIAPQLDTTNVERNLEGLLENINKQTAADQAAAAAKKSPPPGGFELPTGAAQMAAPSLITTSMAKVGALGSSVWSSDSGINVQRDQLATQKRIADSIDSFLKQAGTPAANPYLGSVTPQLGVI